MVDDPAKMYIGQRIESIVDNHFDFPVGEWFLMMLLGKGSPFDPFDCHKRECCVMVDIAYDRRLSTSQYESTICI